MQLQGKVAVITGAASGIGLASVKRFIAEGASVVAGDLNAQRLNQVVADIQSAGGKITGLQGNIADKGAAEELIDLAVRTYGRVDILCNNAGVMDQNEGVSELSDELWQRTLGVNLNGPMYASRRAIPHMLNQGGGSIINVASMAGLSGAAGGVAYTVSKHGLIGLTRSTAWIYGPQGVRCNAICPGSVRTNITESMDFSRISMSGTERIQGFTSLIPAMLEPEEVASLIFFLASDESKHINGAIIPADAGWGAM